MLCFFVFVFVFVLILIWKMDTTDKASEGCVKIKIRLGSWAVSSAAFNPSKWISEFKVNLVY